MTISFGGCDALGLLHDGSNGNRGAAFDGGSPLDEQGCPRRRSRDRCLSLGSRGPNAGITPPPGVYFQDDTYFYSGKIGGTTLPTGGLSGFFLNSF